jgi:membrane-bound serine protease (ClpP class)
VLNEKGQILTLTNLEAEREYGQPPKPLLSAGTVESLDELLKKLGLADAVRVRVQPTGVERIATWINAISPLLLIIGIAGIYIEFKTPGFGLPGIIGIIAFAIYFLGGYVAGLSGMEWVAVFVLGLILVALELFAFPGTIALGFIGVALMLGAIIMAMVDLYPGAPSLPTMPQLRLPMTNLAITFVGAGVVIWVLSRVLPRTPFYPQLVSQSVSGSASVVKMEQAHAAQIGREGVALSPLRPGGKAQFGDQILDVITQGDMIAKGARVKIVGHSGAEAVVEAVG